MLAWCSETQCLSGTNMTAQRFVHGIEKYYAKKSDSLKKKKRYSITESTNHYGSLNACNKQQICQFIVDVVNSDLNQYIEQTTSPPNSHLNVTNIALSVKNKSCNTPQFHEEFHAGIIICKDSYSWII